MWPVRQNATGALFSNVARCQVCGKTGCADTSIIWMMDYNDPTFRVHAGDCWEAYEAEQRIRSTISRMVMFADGVARQLLRHEECE